jgi:hypothetical protein
MTTPLDKQTPPDARPAVADDAGKWHRQRLADGAACHAEARRLLSKHLSVLALCPPDHAGIGLVNPEHARKCKHWGKAPFLRWLDYQTRLPTAGEVGRWWHLMPTANLGCALGPVSGIVRIDGEGRAAREQLLALSGGELPPTWEFASGRRDSTGFGVLYGIPPGVVFRTTSQAFHDGELRFQARGAQTALPPSRHRDGGLYQWLPGRSPDEVRLAPAPRWAVDRWREKPGGRRTSALGCRGVGTGGGAGGPAQIFLAVVALGQLNPARADNYNDWLRVGQALHAVWGGLLEFWDDWSRHSRGKYREGACAAKWRTFRAGGGLRLRHLIDWAHADSGWTPGGES